MSTPSSRLVLVMTSADLAIPQSRLRLLAAVCDRGRNDVPRRACSGSTAGDVSCRRSCVSFSAKARVLAKTTVVRFRHDGPPQAFQQPAVAQAAVRRFAGLNQALDLDFEPAAFPAGGAP